MKLGVVTQVKQATARESRVAASIGFAFGGLVPIGTYVISHYEIDYNMSLLGQVLVYVGAGGLIYSALTVIQWATMMFNGNWFKAVFFVTILEGLMVCKTKTNIAFWLSLVALLFLVIVNGIAVGCTLSSQEKVDEENLKEEKKELRNLRRQNKNDV
jgi:hypothetical protein